MIYTDGIHLVSNTSLEELHNFAKKIELKKCWFHTNIKYPHYDLGGVKGRFRDNLRIKALMNGAIFLTTKELILKIRK